MNASNTGLLIVVSAPSGAGKTTLCQGVMARDSNVQRIITCTTRNPRPGEQNGIDYHFLTRETFEASVSSNAFLEYACVHGNYYGTLKQEVLSRITCGKDVLLNIDVQGAAALRTQADRDESLRKALVTVFVVPPSLAELKTRLTKRAQDPDEVIQRRLQAASAEIARWPEFDYLITNDNLEIGISQLHAIIQAERLRQFRVKPPQL